MRGTLLVGSIGLTLHLVLPQIPGIERSLRLVADTSHLLAGVALLAEFASELRQERYSDQEMRSPGDKPQGSLKTRYLREHEVQG